VKLDALVAATQWGFGLILEDEFVNGLAVKAARLYHGHGDIASQADQPDSAINDDCELTSGEWAAIKPLFSLYVELENARALEASRANGLDPYGRTVAEIEPDIRTYETEQLPRLAFSCLPVSI
jgi:hypothetical protein